MAGFSDNFKDRAEAALKARQAALERFRAKPAPDDPNVLKRAEERKAIQEARAIRMALRAMAKDAEKVRDLAEHAIREVERDLRNLETIMRRATGISAAAEKAWGDAKLNSDRKAARDRRYAARKNRK